MKIIPPVPKQGVLGDGVTVVTPQYVNGKPLTSAASANTWLDAGPPLTCVPADGEFGVNIDGVFRPVSVLGAASAPNLTVTELGVRPNAAEPYMTVDSPLANGFPSLAQPEWMLTGPIISKPQILATTVLDTDISASNPGLIVASPTLFRFPGVINSDGSIREIDHPTYRWRGAVAWDDVAQELSLISAEGWDIQYTLGTGSPDTDYTGPISISPSETSTVHFWMTDAIGIHSPIYAARVSFVDTEPEVSWTQDFPFLAYDPLDPGETAVPSVTMNWDCSTFTLSCPVSGATILYSLDGSPEEPSLTYTTAVSVTDTTTVKFKARKAGRTDSDTFTKVLTFADNVPPENFWNYYDGYKLYSQWTKTTAMLELGINWSYTSILYSVDGSEPSLPYSSPLNITETTTVLFKGQPAGTTQTQAVTYQDNVPPASFSTVFNTSGGALPPENWDVSSGIGYMWTYAATGTTPADPTPQTKTLEAVGTRVTAPFLPPVETLCNGTLKVRAYRYGWALSEVLQSTITVKIGKISCSWDGVDSLTLSCTSGATGTTIKYSLDGSTPSLTYSSPLVITDIGDTIVKFFAEKTTAGSAMGASDTATQTISIGGTERAPVPPDAFEADFLTALVPTVIPTTQMTLVPFRRTPTFYCAPGASGSGLTPDDPAALWTTLGPTYNSGPAYGSQMISSVYQHSATPTMYLAKPDNWCKIFYGIGVQPNTENGTITITGNQTIYYQCRAMDGVTVISGTWKWSRRVDTDTVTATYDDTGKTLTLTGVPADVEALIDTSGTPTSPYDSNAGAIDVPDGTPSGTYYIRLKSTVGLTDIKSITIDPENPVVMLDLTWTNATTTVHNTRPGDVIWCKGGTYSYGSDGANAYVNNGVEMYGGFNDDYTIRDRETYKSYMNPDLTVANPSNLYLYGGLIDGFTWDLTIDSTVVTTETIEPIRLFESPFQGNVVFCNFRAYGRSKGNNAWDQQYVYFNCGSTAYRCNFEFDFKNMNLSGGVYAERWLSDCTLVYDIEAYVPTEAYRGSQIFVSCAALKNSSCDVRLRTYNGTQNQGSTASFAVNCGNPAGQPAMLNSYLTADVVALDGWSTVGASVSTGGCIVESVIDVIAIGGTVSNGGGGLSQAFTYVASRMVDSKLKARVSLGSYPVSDPAATVRTGGFVGDNEIDVEAASTGCTIGGWEDVFQYPNRTQAPRVVHLVEYGAPTGAALSGNPERVNALGSGTGWYSGTPNGPGAPIEGYETTRGTGTQWGRYFET